MDVTKAGVRVTTHVTPDLSHVHTFDLHQQLDDLGLALRELRDELAAIDERIRRTHGGPGRLDLSAAAIAAREPLFVDRDDCNARIYPVRMEIAVIRQELKARPDAEQEAA